MDDLDVEHLKIRSESKADKDELPKEKERYVFLRERAMRWGNWLDWLRVLLQFYRIMR